MDVFKGLDEYHVTCQVTPIYLEDQVHILSKKALLKLWRLAFTCLRENDPHGCTL